MTKEHIGFCNCNLYVKKRLWGVQKLLFLTALFLDLNLPLSAYFPRKARSNTFRNRRIKITTAHRNDARLITESLH